MWILFFLNIQNWFKILEFEKSFTTHKWGKVHDVFKKFVVNYIKKHKNVKKICYDLKILSLLKMEH
jgi:hypothetical protein